MLFQGTQAFADGKDLAIGVGLGLLLNELNKPARGSGRRHPSDTNLGPVEQQRPRQEKSREQIAQEAARRQKIEAERAEVADIQSRLNMLNFDAGRVDGKSGGRTTNAIRAFQQSLGHPQTGSLTAEQKAILVASTSPSAVPPVAPAQNIPGFAGTPEQLAPPMDPIAAADPFANATPLLPQPGNLDLGQSQGQLPAQPQIQAPVQPPAQTPGGATVDPAGSAGLPGQGDEIDVFGVYPGMTGEQALAAMKTAMGAERCSTTATSISCQLDSQTMSDQVVIGLTDPADGALVHSVIRTVKSHPPVPRANIDQRMRDTYPTLVEAPDGIAASGQQCIAIAQGLRVDDFRPLKEWIVSGQPVTAPVASLATACSYYYELAVPAGETIAGLTIALFSGQALLPSLTEGQASVGPAGPVSAPATPDIRF